MAHEAEHDRVRRWVKLPVPAETAWRTIGAFGAVADWHPMVTESPVFDLEGETCRHLRLADGGLFLDRLLESGPTRYRYAMVESPAPFGDGTGALSAVAEPDGGCHVYWSMDFEATDPSADDIAAGLIESGLRALRDRFGGAD